MLYSLFVLVFGIYIGQEYSQIPSIKHITIVTLEFIKREQTRSMKEFDDLDSNDSNDSDNQKSIYEKYYDLFKQLGQKSQ
jgi:hypothetical protein